MSMYCNQESLANITWEPGWRHHSLWTGSANKIDRQHSFVIPPKGQAAERSEEPAPARARAGRNPEISLELDSRVRGSDIEGDNS